jgi:hypothetical protein
MHRGTAGFFVQGELRARRDGVSFNGNSLLKKLEVFFFRLE